MSALRDRVDALMAIDVSKFADDSAEKLLWRICASQRVPGLINGEAVLCEAFHMAALDVLRAALAKAAS